MSKNAIFIKEHEVYSYFKEAGINVPRHLLVHDHLEDTKGEFFKNQEEVVIKGIASDLWHKSDEGALFFEKFDQSIVNNIIKRAGENLRKKYPDISFLVCEKIKMAQAKGMPTEAFLSFKKDNLLGMIINFGIGGLYAELWSENITDKIKQWSLNLTNPLEAFEDFKKHLIGKIWLGNIRQGKALTNEKIMQDFFKAVWDIGYRLEKEGVDLLEVNPVVLDELGDPVILDGVGQKMFNQSLPCFRAHDANKLLNPQKIAIAGVSEKANSFGRKILENLLTSKISSENLKIIKPATEEFLGVKCFSDITTLKKDPVDVLILALPAAKTVDTLTALIEQGAGADFVYIVAGGIGDGADKEKYADKIKNTLEVKRKTGAWTPGIIGPNSLGIILGPLQVNTLFISPQRLPITFHEKGNTALVSQSGAFLITRLSSEPNLPVKYGFAIGSQLDIKASQMLALISKDDDIKIFGFYFEGFEASDALAFSRVAKRLIEQGKHVVLYKGGRSLSGMKAASGHTGAMASDYELLHKTFSRCGIIWADTLGEFSGFLSLLGAYPDLKKAQSVITITNAGFEAVVCADYLGEVVNKHANKVLTSISNAQGFEKLLADSGLSGLVSISNPLDLTPMAGEEVFLRSVELLSLEKDVIILSIVPFTEKLNALDCSSTSEFVSLLARIRFASGKKLIVVVDAGELYEGYRQAFEKQKFPVFCSIEKPMIILKKLFV
ncbi:MAG: hypothetical protein A2381_02345 [Bdellovibrionales bacterium RIFOXYB1_FULL_37_110]|nr:MAG: hypothetical protein A2417_13650 [Bdellovibrionales bacterium RIFOXYC1_FULL_37_79]OFZ59276.1 MAG: hypothetical protein A2381_02345 [Bdellovibrionales bacterium RIFOXYB1_FULL_37_110]OFZ62902.1 MAG: hypothetical protein A2577_11300 [Bdellovibrionales bacterium RIFOXYD1_FULL_36_51]